MLLFARNSQSLILPSHALFTHTLNFSCIDVTFSSHFSFPLKLYFFKSSWWCLEFKRNLFCFWLLNKRYFMRQKYKLLNSRTKIDEEMQKLKFICNLGDEMKWNSWIFFWNVSRTNFHGNKNEELKNITTSSVRGLRCHFPYQRFSYYQFRCFFFENIQ